MKLWTLVRNTFLREFDSATSLLFFAILPLAFTLAVGAGMRPMMDVSEAPRETPIPVEVITEDAGTLSTAFVATLHEMGLRPHTVLTTTDEAFVLEIPPDFSARLEAGAEVTVTLHAPPMEQKTQVVEQAIKAACGRVGGAVLIARMGVDQATNAGLTSTEASRRQFFHTVLAETLASAEHPSAIVEVRWSPGRTDLPSGAAQSSAGQMVTWVQITLLSVAVIFVEERAHGTLQRLLITPTRWATILGGKLLAHLLLGLTQMAVLIVGGELLFRIGWGRSPLAVAFVSTAFALAMLSMGLALAPLVKTRGQASSMTLGLALAMAALGGAWWPLEITPPLYRQVAHLLPTAWVMDAYVAILAREAPLSAVLPQIGVLVGFASLFATIGVGLAGRLRG